MVAGLFFDTGVGIKVDRVWLQGDSIQLHGLRLIFAYKSNCIVGSEQVVGTAIHFTERVANNLDLMLVGRCLIAHNASHLWNFAIVVVCFLLHFIIISSDWDFG